MVYLIFDMVDNYTSVLPKANSFLVCFIFVSAVLI